MALDGLEPPTGHLNATESPRIDDRPKEEDQVAEILDLLDALNGYVNRLRAAVERLR